MNRGKVERMFAVLEAQYRAGELFALHEGYRLAMAALLAAVGA